MTENMDKWASRHRKFEKSGHRVAAKMTPFPRRWYGSMISANQEAIWGMSVGNDYIIGHAAVAQEIPDDPLVGMVAVHDAATGLGAKVTPVVQPMQMGADQGLRKSLVSRLRYRCYEVRAGVGDGLRQIGNDFGKLA